MDKTNLVEQVKEYLKKHLGYHCDACKIDFFVPECPVCRSNLNMRFFKDKKEYGHAWAVVDFLKEYIGELCAEDLDGRFADALEEETNPEIFGYGFESQNEFLMACGSYDDAKTSYFEDDDDDYISIINEDGTKLVFEAEDIISFLQNNDSGLPAEEKIYPLINDVWDETTASLWYLASRRVPTVNSAK